MLLARTASRESCCNSYFGTYAAAAGSRLDGVTSAVTAPPPPVDDFTDEKNEKPLVATQSTSSGELEDEKKPTHLDDPSQPDEVRVDMTSITHPSLTESTALVIPCHNADVEVLKAVLFAALVHFEPWQIFVVDNGNTPTPPTKTWKPPSAHNPCSPACQSSRNTPPRRRQKFTQFYNSTTNFIDWIRLPMFIFLGGSGEFWLRSFAFFLFAPIIPVLLYQFLMVRNRPDLHPHLLDMPTYGIYNLLYSVVCVFGGIRSMLVFFPNHSHRATLEEMEARGDERCIWLKEDFMQNSGGQGDLRDEPQQILLDDAVVAAAGGVEEEARVAQMEQVQTTVLAFDAAEREPSPTAIVVTRPTSTSPMFEAR